MHKVGIVGVGFVGGAMRTVLRQMGFTVNTYDKYKKIGSIVRTVDESDLVFLCLPTPMDIDGVCDLSYVESAVENIKIAASGPKTLVLKSTVPPGTTELLSKKFPQFSWVFNPEFLTERYATEDFRNQDRVILGRTENCGEAEFSTVVDFYLQFGDRQRQFMRPATIAKTDSLTAEMVKYTTNAFFSTKIMYFNVVKELCDKIDVDYENFKNILTLDGRIFPQHQDVPGHDGLRGFGGKCFPKDLNGFIALANSHGVDTKFLQEVWNRNLEIRERRDWEEIKGAVVGAKFDE